MLISLTILHSEGDSYGKLQELFCLEQQESSWLEGEFAVYGDSFSLESPLNIGHLEPTNSFENMQPANHPT